MSEHGTSHRRDAPPAPRSAALGRLPRRTRRGLLGAVAVTGLLGALGAPALAAAPAGDVGAQAELIVNGGFDDDYGVPWWWTENSPGTVVDGQLCAEVPGDTTNVWDAIIGQDDIPLTAGETYAFTYTASATVPVTITTHVQEAAEPYAAQYTSQDDLTATPETFTGTFTAETDDPAAQVVFQIGGSAEPYTFCLDDVSLTDGAG
ncbi:carbohydrate binding domain-containing protein [Streptomyces hoynatensis]|uniref:CBM-cenC domain-containing protein n=1 Tax=Streptomyces hoynatensis TaxID=1141874 RepID=A0A3A9YWX7_9ACTN|nr:carbohydrate binding domain-containing protein [Streptomyces hoynatensis]RKN39726.1 hypothetical protein D7294_19990 [Streptomyces hoynatensis]